MFKIIFVYPDHESVGIEYLMAVCLQLGHSVEYFHYKGCDQYIASSTGEDARSVAARVHAMHGDIVAFSCVTDNYRNQLAIAEEIRKLSDAVIIFGGIHATSVPNRVISQSCIDAVFIGEAESSIKEFLAACGKTEKFLLPDHAIPGVLHKYQHRILGDADQEGHLCDLNELPYPFKESVYNKISYIKNEYSIITSRGCPYSCSYCFNSLYNSKRGRINIRQRSVENVIKELQLALEKYEYSYVIFLDDSFSTNESWIHEFSEQYKNLINKPFACSVNPLYLNERIAASLKYAGCVLVQMGVQSLSDELCQKVLNRKSSISAIENAIKSIKHNNMFAHVDHMLGIPGDTIDTQKDSILFYSRVRPSLISVFWLTWYPGTKIVNDAMKSGLLTDKDLDLIEEGFYSRNSSLHSGGTVKDKKTFLGVALIYNYLPLLPEFIINSFVKLHLYRYIHISNYLFVTVIPRAIMSIMDSRYFIGRMHIKRFISRYSG